MNITTLVIVPGCGRACGTPYAGFEPGCDKSSEVYLDENNDIVLFDRVNETLRVAQDLDLDAPESLAVSFEVAGRGRVRGASLHLPDPGLAFVTQWASTSGSLRVGHCHLLESFDSNVDAIEWFVSLMPAPAQLHLVVQQLGPLLAGPHERTLDTVPAFSCDRFRRPSGKPLYASAPVGARVSELRVGMRYENVPVAGTRVTANLPGRVARDLVAAGTNPLLGEISVPGPARDLWVGFVLQMYARSNSSGQDFRAEPRVCSDAVLAAAATLSMDRDWCGDVDALLDAARQLAGR